MRFPVRLASVVLSAVAVVSLTAVACGDDDDDATATQPAAAATTKPSGGSPAAAAAEAKAAIQDNSFTATVTVAKGGKVTWDWTGSQNPHSVIGTSANAKTLLSSPVNREGKGTYTATFAEAGTYEYQCGIHGASMTGKVVVQ